MFCDAQDTARANSLTVAKVFGKRHADVLRDIEKITAPKSIKLSRPRSLNICSKDSEKSSIMYLPSPIFYHLGAGLTRKGV